MLTFEEMETRINNSEIIDPVIDQEQLTRPSQYTKEEFMSKCPGIWPSCDQETEWLDEWMEEHPSGRKLLDYEAIDKMMLDHFREKGEERRAMHRAVFYTFMILMGIVIWFVTPDIQSGWKITIDVVLALIMLGAFLLDNVPVVDQDLPLSPDEQILQDELERRES